MIDAGEFDYVIAGGGTAGCVVAARLTEDPDVTVCLLEAGPSDVDDPRILRLEDWMYLLDSGYDWDYPIEPQARGNSFMRHARAKVLGGCSSHNSCIAFWTPKEDLDEWAAMGCEGWSAADCWPLIKRLETNDGPGDHHGRDGPVNIRTVPPDDPCGVSMLEAAAQAGLPTSRFNEGHTVTNGAGWFQINSSADNTRMSSSHAYLHPILGSRPNLEIRTACWVKRVALEDGRATAVEYLTPDLLTQASVKARREVILSAGAIDTPKLLMLSGIGPGEHLHEFGIETLVHAPGVGSNLDDHVEGIVQWDAKQADDPQLDAVVGDRVVRDVRGRPRPARSDDALRLGAVRHEHRAVGLPDDRERVLPDAERVPRPLAWDGQAALVRLPRPRARRPALLH